jgi:hypothetical protein
MNQPSRLSLRVMTPQTARGMAKLSLGLHNVSNTTVISGATTSGGPARNTAALEGNGQKRHACRYHESAQDSTLPALMSIEKDGPARSSCRRNCSLETNGGTVNYVDDTIFHLVENLLVDVVSKLTLPIPLPFVPTVIYCERAMDCFVRRDAVLKVALYQQRLMQAQPTR